MAGIYIHIPYCRVACSYCDFYFSVNQSSKSEFVSTLIKEINLRKGDLNYTVETIYFGGGTPSVLTQKELDLILTTIHKEFSIGENPEITLEANPDDLTEKYIQEIKFSGVNRLSVGLQSFNEDELKRMNRSHNALQGLEAIKRAQQAGITNISVDLIYGTPWIDLEQWKNHIDTVISMNVPHISCYQLTIEEGTLLHHQQKKGEFSIDDEHTEQQFYTLIEKLRESGFDHYEVSNFGKPGFYSQHNSSYWLDKPYLGLGPSAHGYNGNERYANVSNVHAYIKSINEGGSWFEVEKLTQTEMYNDLVLTGLRTTYGLSLRLLEKKLGQSYVNYFQRKAQSYLENGHLLKENYTYKLNEKSFLFADRISSDLFYI